MATNVSLTRDLERFARSCVKSGRYNNVSEVVREGLRLLQDREAQKKAFLKMLRDTEAEADKKGWRTIDEVAREMDAVIAGKR
jgi:antitoxin ParD1/3/4